MIHLMQARGFEWGSFSCDASTSQEPRDRGEGMSLWSWNPFLSSILSDLSERPLFSGPLWGFVFASLYDQGEQGLLPGRSVEK